MSGFLYEKIADELARDIAKGIYNQGDKLPSLRRVCAQYKVSMATVIQAYQFLESQNIIEARPRSGYRVSVVNDIKLEEPETSRPRNTAMDVNVGQLAMSLVSEARQPGLVRLGAAVPEPAMLPLGILSRTIAGVSRRNPNAIASYEQTQGGLVLRKQIARTMRDRGVRCGPEDIIITNGCLEALSLSLRAIAERGSTIAIESPTYFGILQVIESLGMKVVEIPTNATSGVDLIALETSLKKRRISACVFMPNFNNPLGSMMTEQNKKALASLLQRYQVPLIEDDVYGTLAYDGNYPRPVKFFDQQDNVLYCSSFSKVISPGLRIGWIVAGAHVEKLKYYKFLENISTGVIPQLAMAEFMAKGGVKRAVNRAIAVYRHRMEFMRRCISHMFPAGTRISSPQGGFLLWVELPRHIDSLDFYQKAIKKKIAITPGVLFSAQGQYKHHVRLSCGAVDNDQIKRSIGILAELCR